MKNFNLNIANNDEWLTPPEILRALGPFDLDPAAPIVRPWDMAARHYTKLDDGMAQPWEGRLRFHYVNGVQGGPANAPACLVSYSKADTAKLQQAHAQGRLAGALINLR